MTNTAHAAPLRRGLMRSAAPVRDRYSADIVPAAARAYQAGEPPPRKSNRSASFVPSSYDAAAHTVEVVLSAGSRVIRWYGIEELLIDPVAVDLSRVAGGQIKALDSHNAYTKDAILGTVLAVRFEAGQLIGLIKFGETPAALDAEGMVARGELTSVSIGYDVSVWSVAEIIVAPDTGAETYVWRATAWTLLEVSFVSVPADPNARVRSAVAIPGDHQPPAGPGNIEEEDDMHIRSAAGTPPAPTNPAAPAPAPAPAAARAADPLPTPAAPTPGDQVARLSALETIDLLDQARTFGIESETRTLIEQNAKGEVGPERVRKAMLDAAAEKQRVATARAPAGASARAGDESEASRISIAEAIFARATGKAPSERAREFMEHRLLEIAISRAGLNPRERDSVVILRAANTTSDFPLILEAAANKVLLDRYQTAVPTYRAIAKRRDLRDFKPTKLLRIGDFPTLEAYAEDGEIKSGTVNEGREEVTLGSYGKILRLSRQTIVNDDLNAFDDVFSNIGTTIALFENSTFYAQKAANSGGGPKLADGVNLFHATHANLAVSGAAISVVTLGTARSAIRKQKNLDGKVLNLNPRILFVGADQETAAEQVTASITPRNPDDVNPFSGKLSVVAEGAISGNAWEVYADPMLAPVWSFGYLAEAPGPRVLTEQPFNFDGMAWRATLDFYAGPVDFRGGYRNPGQ